MQVNESQASAAERPGINHNTTQNRFELEVDGQLAHADYRREDNVLIFHHTWVPEDLRGKGHAAAVVRAGLEYARNSGFKVVPRCSYVARYIERNPDYAGLVLPR